MWHLLVLIQQRKHTLKKQKQNKKKKPQAFQVNLEEQIRPKSWQVLVMRR